MSRPEIPLETWDTYLAEDADSYQAFEDIVYHYQYLVEGCARKLERKLPSYLEDSELISFGQLGLLRAITKYQPSQGPFSRYASAVIYGAVIDGLRAADFAPRGLRKQQRELDLVVKDLQNEGLAYPTNGDIAERMEVSEEEVHHLQKRILKADVSPQDPTLLGAGRDSSNLWSREICREFVVWLKKKDELTQKVIALKYWEGLNLKTISARLEMPVEQIRARHQEVLAEIIPFARDLAIDE